MKIKVNFLVVILYVMALITSYGIFNTVVCEAEVNTVDMVDTCAYDNVYPVKASVSPNPTTYNTYLEAYFSNLTENFPENYKGSCGFVAMCMMLSYFDNFYSDDIVHEYYDVRTDGTGRNMILRNSSPGTLNDENYLYTKYPNSQRDINNISAQEYYNYLLDYERYSLHAELILYADRLKHIYDFDDKVNPCGITMSEMDDVIKYYLMYKRGFEIFKDFNVYSVESDDEDKVKQFVIDKIDKGLPVYTCLTGDNGGHATVAYAHDSNGNIYLHSGWHGYGTRQTVSSLYFKKMYRALAIEFFLPEHAHSDNYAVTRNGDTNYYCFCSDEIVTYNHNTHNYMHDHIKINGDTHYAYCACGDYITENHSYKDRYEKSTQTYHKSYCKCGASINENHLWQWNSVSTLSIINRSVKCAQCNYIKILTDDEYVPVILNKKYNNSVF